MFSGGNDERCICDRYQYSQERHRGPELMLTYYNHSQYLFKRTLYILAKMIVEKGLDNVNISMLSPEQKKELLKEVAQIFYRLGKTISLLRQ